MLGGGIFGGFLLHPSGISGLPMGSPTIGCPAPPVKFDSARVIFMSAIIEVDVCLNCVVPLDKLLDSVPVLEKSNPNKDSSLCSSPNEPCVLGPAVLAKKQVPLYASIKYPSKDSKPDVLL